LKRTFFDRNRIWIGLLASLIFVLLFVGIGFFSHADTTLSDKLFFIKQETSPVIVVTIEESTLSELGGWPLNRELYVKLIENLEEADAVIFDISFFDETENDELLAKALERENVFIASELVSTNKGIYEKKPIFNVKTGFVNVHSDPDGIARHAYLEFSANMFSAKSVELEVFNYLNSENIKFELESNKKNLLSYYGNKENFENYLFEEVYNGKISKELFQGKVVFIGSNVLNLHDFVNTPVKSNMPGVVYHANIYLNLVNDGFVSKLNPLIYSLLLVLIVFLIGRKLKAIYMPLIVLGLLIFTILLSIFLIGSNVLLSFFYPIVSVLAGYGLLLVFEYYFTSREKLRVRNLFGKYVSNNVVTHMLENPDKYSSFNAERRHITVVFADIRGFTKMSSGMEPEEIVELLNTYLDEMTEIIFKHGGTLDKYVGDEIMAVFNSPTDLENHEQKAFECAKEMQRHIVETNKKTGKDLKYGIGVNTGYAVVGSFGSRHRLEFGVLGDTINVGARFCSAAKGNEVVIGQSTHHGLTMKDKDNFIEEEYELKGKGNVKAYKWTYK
jgi:adenylate cyclase